MYSKHIDQGDTEMNAQATVKAVGYAYDSATRDWTKKVEYVARDRMEAIRWMNFNRDWFTNLHIED